jgi:hypothetical protein
MATTNAFALGLFACVICVHPSVPGNHANESFRGEIRAGHEALKNSLARASSVRTYTWSSGHKETDHRKDGARHNPYL